MAVLLYLLLLSSLGLCADAYKILVVFPFPGKSHGILGDGVVKHLLVAGHQVTYVSPLPMANPHKNLKQVVISDSKKHMPLDLLNLQALLEKKVNLGNEDLIQEMMTTFVTNVLKDQILQNFLEDPKQQFDAVITEWMFSEIYAGFAAVFNCPHIWFFPFEDPAVVLRLIDEYPNPAYTTGLSLSSELPYSFKQRAYSLWYHIKSSFKKNFLYLKSDSLIYEKYFGPVVSKKGRQLPSYEEVRMNSSLALVNAHISFGLSIKRPFNYVNIGGYHIDSSVKPLPQDLKEIMDGAKHGVIYFSMGSNLQSKQLPQQLKIDLLKVFGGLKQIVLWKFEEELPDLPKNVHILNWAPQPSILSHPNCILFITHGGLLSTTETIHFGVPAIGIPVFGDQFQNVDAAVSKGYVKRVDLTYSLAEDLEIAINDIISDPKYTERVKQLSQIYHDRPVPAGAELVHWVEHVVRTAGAPHLRSPALLLPWYQKMYLDLAALLIVTSGLMTVALIAIIKRSFGSKIRTYQKKKKN